MHKVKANQKVRIFQVEIAVPIESDKSEVSDEISTLLTENGIASDDSNILDWEYTEKEWTVKGGDDPEEGEVFNLPREAFV